MRRVLWLVALASALTLPVYGASETCDEVVTNSCYPPSGFPCEYEPEFNCSCSGVTCPHEEGETCTSLCSGDCPNSTTECEEDCESQCELVAIALFDLPDWMKPAPAAWGAA